MSDDSSSINTSEAGKVVWGPANELGRQAGESLGAAHEELLRSSFNGPVQAVRESLVDQLYADTSEGSGMDLATWLLEQVADDEQVARAASLGPWSLNSETFAEAIHAADDTAVVAGGRWGGEGSVFDSIDDARHIVRWDPAHVLAECDAKRRILAEHEPEWQTVEWPHDQNGKGEALCCPRCQNAEHTEWHPPFGKAGVLPEGFVSGYVLAPCLTLRILASVYVDRPGYREEWKP
jgi:hypothetical protein